MGSEASAVESTVSPAANTPSEPEAAELTKGTAYGFAAYAMWGLFPLYFHALIPAGAWEILAHRIVWTLLLCLALLAVTRNLTFLRRFLRTPRLVLGTTIAAIVLAANWVIYVLAVMPGHVTEAALGYFLNPLVTVMLGVVILGEKLRRLQWAAVAIGLIASVYLSIDYGQPPWISVGLALSFAAYGLMKKRVGGQMNAVESLSAETPRADAHRRPEPHSGVGMGHESRRWEQQRAVGPMPRHQPSGDRTPSSTSPASPPARCSKA